ncbi:hypothetical protein Adt_14735 [Abeliophyllum distichum]|uniref:Uncharacterized protein n=1 Tax=Abeliophyllum distichum TaxID=126358 RepID=A0ABD1U0G8_9LAMI
MLAWKMSKRLTSSAIDNVLESKEVELDEVYWQELIPCVEEEDTAFQDSKGNETEHDAEPSHFFHQHSSYLNHHRLIQQQVPVKVQPMYLRLNQKWRKRRRLDDVVDKLEKERILEDEAGEELVGGKKAGEDENVTDETEYVEKRMSADFLTTEKLEEDANKSIEGDIIQIEDTGCESPKIREHRIKKKSTPIVFSPS